MSRLDLKLTRLGNYPKEIAEKHDFDASTHQSEHTNME
jgi:DNA-binding CsgD family transcriptional regulator